MLKGEIDLERSLNEGGEAVAGALMGNEILSNGCEGDIPEFFQSVKSNSHGGFGVFSIQGDD
jgi:hypothetical protein